jgi:DNA (cytosine-5)-methyltransferase 1
VIRFLSVCSGIEAASVAWDSLGWKAIGFSELDPFPCEVLKHRYPGTPNLGDATQLPDMIGMGLIEAPDLLCGGTPCQAFSVAGNRQSLDDERGNLSLVFCEIADAIDDERSIAGQPACVVLWENVPGVFSTKDNAFGCFIGKLAGEDIPVEPPGERWSNAGAVLGPKRTVAWRVLDAQYFGLAQRRKRVFVVASAREGFDPTKVLFEFDGMRRDIAPSREARQTVARGVALSVALRGREGGSTAELGDEVQNCLRASSGGGDKPHVMAMAHGQGGAEIASERRTTLTCNHEAPIVFSPVTHTLRGEGFDASEDGEGRGTPLVPVPVLAFDTTQVTSKGNVSNPKPGDPCHPLAAGAHAPAIAFTQNQREEVRTVEVAGELAAQPGMKQQTYLQIAMQVRRLTPRECERLQGFPDDYTAIPWRKKTADQCPDGPRYKALGNSMAVPVMRWIGERIQGALT